MCGFYLAYTLEHALSETEKKHRSLRHRGPDAEGVFDNGPLFIHFYRLAILGGEAGNQPMTSSSGRYTLTFNGEIYNYREIANQLGVSELAAQGDTRVLLEVFERRGLEGVELLNGMFAIALYDRHTQSLALIRDRFGVKPLYYTKTRTGLAAASEIKALWNQQPPSFQKNVLKEYLDFGIYPADERTFYEGVSQVRPGTYLTFSKDGIKETRYFEIAAEIRSWQERRPTSEEFESILADSIRLRLRSDIPIDLHYSGGTDSTAILLKTKEVWGWDYPLETYTFAYNENAFDESQFAKRYCESLGIVQHTTRLKAQEVPYLAEELQKFEDEPYGGIPMIAYYQSNIVQKQMGFTVALEGQGGDEAFGGYPTHLLLAAYDLLLTGSDASLLESLRIRLGLSLEELKLRAERHVEAGFASHSDLTDLRVGRNPQEKVLGSWLLSIQLYDLLQNKLPRVLRFEDRASMAASREIRFPLLDYRVMSCALALSLQQKFAGGFSKAPLLSIIHKHLKTDFLSEKRSVVTPQTTWLLGPLKPWVQNQLKALKSRRFIEDSYIEKGESLLGSSYLENSFYLWQLVNTELMLKNLETKF